MKSLWPLLTLALMAPHAPLTAVESPVPAQGSGPAVDQNPFSKGLWWLYHLQYERAYQSFDEHSRLYPEDPSGLFYKAATDWWHLAQEFDQDLPEVRSRFHANVQETIQKATELAQKTSNPKEKAKAYLYRGGAEGLWGRWLVTQKQWVKAYFAGKNGYHFLQLAVKYDPTLYDAYMGLGIYDYFTDTLSGVHKVLAALLIHGDKARGLQELQLAITKGEFARVEAQIFLIEIYTSEERQPQKALPIARALRREFPLSPAMHLAEVMTLYTMKDWNAMRPEAESFLEKSRRETPYFTHKGIRPALYCLAMADLWDRHDLASSFKRLGEILSLGDDSSRWVTFAYLRQGQIYDMQGERDKALAHYRKILTRQDLWGAHREANRYIASPFKGSGPASD
jgi:hypothetical protein